MFVVLAGQWGRYSVGNEIALTAVRDLVRSRWPAAGIIVVSSFPVTLQRMLGLPAVGWWRIAALPRLLFSARAWLVLDETNAGILTRIHRAALKILSRISGIPFVLVRSQQKEADLRIPFSTARHGRDSGQPGMFAHQRFIRITDDPAILAPPPDAHQDDIPGRPPRIVCLLSGALHPADDPDMWAKVADTLVQRLGAVMVFVSERADSPAHFVLSVIARMRSSGRLATWNNGRDYLSIISGADLAICQSPGALIAAASCGVPSLTVSDSQRTWDICAQFEQQFFSAEAWSSASVAVAHVLDAWEWRDVCRANLLRILPTARLTVFRRIERALAPALD